MSKSIEFLYHPSKNYPVPIDEGFSWPNLFFGSFQYLYKGIDVWAIITLGFSQVVFPFFANRHHTDLLYKKGYLSNPRNDI